MPTKKDLGIIELRFNSSQGIECKINCSIVAITREWAIVDIPDNGQLAIKLEKIINKKELL